MGTHPHECHALYLDSPLRRELMIRRALLLFTLAAIYIAYKRSRSGNATPGADQAADAQWANEGGANAPASV